MFLFITLPEGYIVNVDNVSHISKQINGSLIALKSMTHNSYVTGSWSAGGAGNANGSNSSEHSYITTILPPQELLALINNKVALVEALENAAQKTYRP